MNILDFLHKANELMMLSSKFLIDLKNSTEPLEYKEGDNFIQLNSRRPDIGFLVEGSAVELRSLDGMEYCCGLYPSGSLILPISSMFLDEPSPVQVRFLEDSKVYILEFRTLQALQKKFDDTNYLIQFYLAHEMAQRQTFAFHMRFDTPENRIKLIKEQYLQSFNLLSREQQSQLCNIQARDIPKLL
jgi:signal-transduction protein with cAMP-binding, CBS, and nucleotidyltransferase domain